MTGPGRAPRIAIVHDWLTGMRGGEKILDAVCGLYPDAALFTLVYVPGSVSPAIARLGPRASILSAIPGIERVYRHLLPLFPALVEQFDLDAFDLVISTSHCAAKPVVRPGRARHLCYGFTPMRYEWDQRRAYFGSDRLGPGARRVLAPVLAWLARWDASTAHRVDRYLADSRHVAGRIQRYYGRRSRVVHPPVDTGFYCPAPVEPAPAALVVSALVPYKRIDLAVAACRIAGVRLTVVGQGPEEARRRAMAGLVVLAYYLQGHYRAGRSRTMVGEFFAVSAGSLIAVALGMWATRYFQACYAGTELKQVGALEVSRLAWAIFLVVNVLLPLGEHASVAQVVEAAGREGVDVKIVPDLLQFITLRARLEGLDGRAFTVYKFRSMSLDAERETGPVWSRDDDPRCTPLGRVLRRIDIDELPQIWNVFTGDMSLVGRRPERPVFVGQFKRPYPQYMLRHKVRAGITGWAQVNGWRGNPYIGNWSLRLDLKIRWLTVVRSLFQHAD